jgi:hypothetical protein
MQRAMTEFIRTHSKSVDEDSSLIKYAPWVREKLKMISVLAPHKK